MTTSLIKRLLRMAIRKIAFEGVLETKAFRFKAAFAAFMLSVGLCTLAVPNAGAATVPLVNGDLYDVIPDGSGQPSGWSIQYAALPYPGYSTGWVSYDGSPDSVRLGINRYLMLYCVANCPGGSTNSMSQQVNGLIVGNQYRVSTYASGYRRVWPNYSPPAPMTITLGNQSSGPIDVQYNYSPLTNWFLRTTEFIYRGPGSSAVLSIIQNVTGLTVGCEPCQEALFLAKVSMEDLGPTTPTLHVQKALGTAGRIDNADQFKVSIVNASTSAVLSSATTSGTGTSITGGLANITGDTSTTYKVAEEMLSGSKSKIAQYDASLLCRNATSGGTQFPTSPMPITQSLPLLKAGDDVTCTLTNTPKAPTLRLSKALGTGGRADPADQFVTVIQERLLDKWTSPPSTGIGSAISGGSTGWVTLALNTPYTLKETMAANSGSIVTQYTPVVTCNNALTGSPTAVPFAPGVAFTPVPGDVLDCTLTNTRLPVQLRVSQRLLIAAPYIFKPPVDFTYTGSNGWTNQPLSVLKDNQVTTGALQTLTAPLVETTLSATTTAPNWYVASYRCTDGNAATSGNSPALVATSTNTSITIPASKVRAGAVITCAMIQSYRQ